MRCSPAVVDLLQERKTFTTNEAGSNTLFVPSSKSVEVWVILYGVTADAEPEVVFEGSADDRDDASPVWGTCKVIEIPATPAIITELGNGPIAFPVAAARANGDAYGEQIRIRVRNLGGGESLDIEVKALIRE